MRSDGQGIIIDKELHQKEFLTWMCSLTRTRTLESGLVAGGDLYKTLSLSKVNGLCAPLTKVRAHIVSVYSAAGSSPIGTKNPMAAERAEISIHSSPESIIHIAGIVIHIVPERLFTRPEFASSRDCYIRIKTDFVSVYNSIPSAPCSRPMPLCLKPPNGSAGSIK